MIKEVIITPKKFTELAEIQIGLESVRRVFAAITEEGISVLFCGDYFQSKDPEDLHHVIKLHLVFPKCEMMDGLYDYIMENYEE